IDGGGGFRNGVVHPPRKVQRFREQCSRRKRQRRHKNRQRRHRAPAPPTETVPQSHGEPPRDEKWNGLFPDPRRCYHAGSDGTTPHASVAPPARRLDRQRLAGASRSPPSYNPLMRIKLFILLPFIAALASAQVTYIKTSSLIDGRSDAPKENQIIVIRGNRIESVGAATAIPDGAHVIDLTGMTVMPGLIDSHTHIFLQGEDASEGGYDVQLLKYPLAYRAARATVSARRALEQGFTTIRDVETEGAGYGDIGIKQAINEGRIPGPRIFASTRAISTTGGYDLEGYAPEITVPKGAQLIDGPVEARKAAREQLDHGADWIKVYMTHRSWLDKQGNL